MINTQAQEVAKRAIKRLGAEIRIGMSEQEIHQRIVELMKEEGATSFWHGGIPGTVFVGQRSLVSAKTRLYQPSAQQRVAEGDAIAIDIAPAVDGMWGDYARTYFIEDGKAYMELQQLKDPLHRQALQAELDLHHYMMEIATPEMTYSQLYYKINQKCEQMEWKNLDFQGYWGHSVSATGEDDRIYIVPENHQPLGSRHAFTFEPHLQLRGFSFGVKRENIYYFEGDTLKEL